MRLGVVLVLLGCGCRQLLGFEAASAPPVTDDAPVDASDLIDTVVDAPIDPNAITVTFQQGINNYTGARDTFIELGDGSHATDTLLRWKTDSRYTLIAFDLSAIPATATIPSAELFVTLNQDNAAGDLVEVAVPWADTVTFATLGATSGVTAEDLGVPVATLPVVTGISSMNVTSSIAAWVANPSSNQGWIFVANNNSGGDSQMRSSEDGTLANRPRLVVTYVL